MADKKHLFPALTAACLYARAKDVDTETAPTAQDDVEHSRAADLCAEVVEAANTPDLVRAA